MSGRSRLSRHQELHGFRDDFQPPSRRGHSPMSLPPIKEELATRRDEIRRLRTDKHLQEEENVALRREIADAKEEIHALGQVITKVRADKEDQARELIQKGLKLEKELRGLEPLRDELLKLESEAQKLDILQKELSRDVHNMSKELKHLQAENQQIPTLRLEIDGLHQELVRARTVYEYEKKANVDQMEQRQVLDKNLASMAREVEKLIDHMSLENRARGSDSFSTGPLVYGSGYRTRVDEKKKISVFASVKKVEAPLRKITKKSNEKTVKKSVFERLCIVPQIVAEQSLQVVNRKQQVVATSTPSLTKTSRRNKSRRMHKAAKRKALTSRPIGE